jgi:hydrogenase expression/formation protein HypC
LTRRLKVYIRALRVDAVPEGSYQGMPSGMPLVREREIAALAAGVHLMCLAVPGKVVEILDDADIDFRRAKVDFGGIRKEVNLAYTPEAEIGTYVLVHVGFALSVIDEAEAQRVFEYLRQIGGLEEELGEVR